MSTVSAYVYNQMYNQNGYSNSHINSNNEFVLRGGLPVANLLNSTEVGGGVGGTGDALDGKVVPIGLNVMLRQPKRNTKYNGGDDYEEVGGAPVISEDVFDRLFVSVSPSSKRRRTTPTKRTRGSDKGITRKIPKKKST